MPGSGDKSEQDKKNSDQKKPGLRGMITTFQTLRELGNERLKALTSDKKSRPVAVAGDDPAYIKTKEYFAARKSEDGERLLQKILEITKEPAKKWLRSGVGYAITSAAERSRIFDRDQFQIERDGEMVEKLVIDAPYYDTERTKELIPNLIKMERARPLMIAAQMQEIILYAALIMDQIADQSPDLGKKSIDELLHFLPKICASADSFCDTTLYQEAMLKIYDFLGESAGNPLFQTLKNLAGSIGFFNAELIHAMGNGERSVIKRVTDLLFTYEKMKPKAEQNLQIVKTASSEGLTITRFKELQSLYEEFQSFCNGFTFTDQILASDKHPLQNKLITFCLPLEPSPLAEVYEVDLKAKYQESDWARNLRKLLYQLLGVDPTTGQMVIYRQNPTKAIEQYLSSLEGVKQFPAFSNCEGFISFGSYCDEHPELFNPDLDKKELPPRPAAPAAPAADSPIPAVAVGGERMPAEEPAVIGGEEDLWEREPGMPSAPDSQLPSSSLLEGMQPSPSPSFRPVSVTKGHSNKGEPDHQL